MSHNDITHTAICFMVAALGAIMVAVWPLLRGKPPGESMWVFWLGAGNLAVAWLVVVYGVMFRGY
jgi:hypothetical protein